MLYRIYKINGTKQLVGVPVPDCTETELVYDSNTKIVYYKFFEQTPKKYANEHNGFMSPYLGIHGRPCRFINEEIKEITKDE